VTESHVSVGFSDKPVAPAEGAVNIGAGGTGGIFTTIVFESVVVPPVPVKARVNVVVVDT
jgi:hypothetical protein